MDTPSSSNAHQEETHNSKVKYRKDVLSFVESIKQQGNPFVAGSELVALATREVMDQEVVRSLCKVHDDDKDSHEQYVAQTLDKATVSRNNILTFAIQRDLSKKGNNTRCTQKKIMTPITHLSVLR